MFRELLKAAERFRADGDMGPRAYTQKAVHWIIELGGEQPHVSGRFSPKELRRVFAPDRYRSGKRSSLKPFFLLETAEVLFTMDKNLKPVHDAYIQLLEEAAEHSGDAQDSAEVQAILDFVKGPPPVETKEMRPKDLVAVRTNPLAFPFERQGMQRFWAAHLESELSSEYQTACLVCGNERKIVRTFPRPIVLFGQKCQITSFDDPSFRSFGRKQTENSPICFQCASTITDTLDYLVAGATGNHRSEIVREQVRPNGPADPFRSQLAVYWLSHPVELQEPGAVLTDEALSAVLAKDFLLEEIEEIPQANLRHVENLLRIPWSPKDASLNLATEKFHLAVLSANKGRLAVREWFSVSLADLQERLRRFLDSGRLVGFSGEEPRPHSITAMLDALGSHDPNLARGLLRTAYLGQAPPSALLLAAVRRLSALWLKGRQEDGDKERERVRHIESLTSAIKIGLFYGKEEEHMEELNPKLKTAPRLCGTLLAVLEEAQQRAANWRLNSTIVNRFYGSASTAPCSVFGNLIRLATVAHLPEVGRDLNVLMEEVMKDLDKAGGFPPTLTASGQAEFALGFYRQRADFRAKRGQK